MAREYAAPIIEEIARTTRLCQFSRPRIEDICINRPGEAFVRENGRFHRYEIPLPYDDCFDFARYAGACSDQDIDQQHPLLATELPDGSRLQAIIPPCVPQGTVSLTIRRHSGYIAPIESVPQRYRTYRWNKWAERHASRRARDAHVLTFYDAGDIVGFLREIVQRRFTLVLVGATGSGKTTMLNSLLAEIDHGERLITIENAAELTITQPNHVRLLYSHGDQSVARVGQRQLLQATLRMRPDRCIIGELRDPEATYIFVEEVGTGHPGSATTIHGKNAGEGVRRLFDLMRGSPEGRAYDDATIVSKLNGAVDVIIPFEENKGTFELGEVWLRADAERRGATIAELMED